MIDEQEPNPNSHEQDEPYRPSVESMNFGQVEQELRDVFGVAVMYLLVPIFLVVTGSITAMASEWLVRVLPGLAAVFVCYWVLLRAFGPMYDAAPELAIQYALLVSRLGGGIMDTSHRRLLALAARREELKTFDTEN
ncbi:hypothetical protein DTL42_15295 [Bremerella cremea]|uniref:Uncharacterized protein n=1 Tax=Bremerella cremea TaxID=1031537 RepID=A0A368KP61_9BACT|nr:hypothetical protein [Bremerella cremea]RCS46332.1 hypothetical protein DTL42_15295 [Bremerella cremea]